MKEKDILLIANLRANARDTLTSISKKIKMPISTIFDRIKLYQQDVIKKHTTLIDFGKLGYNTRAHITLKTSKNNRENLKNYLLKQPNVNTLYKINNGYDFLVEVIFRGLKELEEFNEAMDEKFRIKSRQVYYIIEDIKKENFLSDPELVKVTKHPFT